MNEKNLKKLVLTGLFWKFAERMGAQLVTFVVSIIIARILAPEDYGVIALVLVFVSIANTLVTSGFGNSLIQKVDADELDFSSVFYFNLLTSVVMYVLLYIMAPYIAIFFEQPILSSLLRVLGIRIIISGVNSVQQAYVTKKMIFKKFFFSTLGGTIGSAIVGVVMAYKGFGVWALVAQYLFNTIVDTLVLWITVKWRPLFKVSFSRLKTLITYGWKILVSGLLDTVYNELRNLLIGKYYSSSQLAFYNKGQQYPKLVIDNVNASISSVLFPAYALCQKDTVKLKSLVRRSIKTSMYIIMPIMVGLAVIAKPLVILMLTEKWLPCVPYLQIGCIMYIFWPIHTSNLEVLKALGRSDLFLKLEIIKKGIGLVILLVSARYGVMAIAISGIVVNIICVFINAYPNGRLVQYRYRDLAEDVTPNILLCVVMGGIVYLVGQIPIGMLESIALQITVGVVVYLGTSYFSKIDSFGYLMNTLKNGVGRKPKWVEL